MKHILAVAAAATLLLVSCSDTDPVDPGTAGKAAIKVVAFDAPNQALDAVILDVERVEIHDSEADTWIVLSTPDLAIDFLKLVNGESVLLADTAIDPGTYSQLRLVLGDGNRVVVDGDTSELVVPSGQQTGVKLNLNATFAPDEIYTIFVDFDATKSVKWNPGQQLYMMQPTFKAWLEAVSATAAGIVVDDNGNGIEGARVEAVSVAGDTVASITTTTGAYLLTVPASTWTISASADGYTVLDTVYSITLGAQENRTNLNFVLSP